MSKPNVYAFSNTPWLDRRIDDLLDLLASIEDHGELHAGEKQRVQQELVIRQREKNRR